MVNLALHIIQTQNSSTPFTLRLAIRTNILIARVTRHVEYCEFPYSTHITQFETLIATPSTFCPRGRSGSASFPAGSSTPICFEWVFVRVCGDAITAKTDNLITRAACRSTLRADVVFTRLAFTEHLRFELVIATMTLPEFVFSK